MGQMGARTVPMLIAMKLLAAPNVFDMSTARSSATPKQGPSLSDVGVSLSYLIVTRILLFTWLVATH